jgi:hypothetical protein
MLSSGIWYLASLVKTDVLEESVASIFRVEIISKLGTAITVYYLLLTLFLGG